MSVPNRMRKHPQPSSSNWPRGQNIHSAAGGHCPAPDHSYSVTSGDDSSYDPRRGRRLNMLEWVERCRMAARAREARQAQWNDSTRTDESSRYPYDSSGRTWNSHPHYLGDCSSRVEDLRTRESRLQLECEMARAKEAALEVLRGGQLDASESRPRTQVPSTAATGAASVGLQPRQQPCIPDDKLRRRMEALRNITYHRGNLTTPKRQRGVACSTPISHITSHSSVQRMPRVCPRPTSPPVCVRPSRSSSAAGARTATPERQYPAILSSNKPRYPMQPAHAPRRSPVRYQVQPSTDATPPGHVTTVTTTTTTRPIPPSQKQPIRSPSASPDRSSSPSFPLHADPSQRQHSQNVRTASRTNIRQIDSAYGRTVPRALLTPSGFITTPGQPPSVMQEQLISPSIRQTDTSAGSHTAPADNSQLQTSREQDERVPLADQAFIYQTPSQDPNNAAYRQLYRFLERSNSPGRRHPETASGAHPAEESYYYNPAMFDEPSHYRRRPNECLPSDYVDLTDTQYECDPMDLSVQEILDLSPHRGPRERLHPWTIAPTDDDDVVCLGTIPDVCPPAATAPTEPSAYEPTEYEEIPSQAPCDRNQPRATLFRCLAQKLNSTYDFISSLIAPERPTGALKQSIERTARHVCPESSDAASARDCAIAKRCGRVKFDSPDKPDDPHLSAIHKAEIEHLVEDNYCPGIIQDTVDGRQNFNDFAFNIFLAARSTVGAPTQWPPREDPMTLLEAFFMRIEKERAHIENDIKENATKEKVAEVIHQYFDKGNRSDLNRSIESLMLSEQLQDRERVDKSKETSLQADVQKWVSKWPGNARVELKAYTGRTKPFKELEAV